MKSQTSYKGGHTKFGMLNITSHSACALCVCVFLALSSPSSLVASAIWPAFFFIVDVLLTCFFLPAPSSTASRSTSCLLPFTFIIIAIRQLVVNGRQSALSAAAAAAP